MYPARRIELEKKGVAPLSKPERIPALFYINIWARPRWEEDDELGVHRFTRAFWVTRNGLDPCRPSFYSTKPLDIGRSPIFPPTPKRDSIPWFPFYLYAHPPLYNIYIYKKKNPVKVADNRLPLSLHSIDFTPFSLPSNSPFLDWKAIPYAINAIRWVRIFLIHRNLILINNNTIIVEERTEGEGGA